MRKLLSAALAAALIAFAPIAAAQWQVPQYSVPIGLGSGTGFGSAAPGAAGVPFVSQGASANPAFGTAGVAGGGTGATTLTNHGVLLGQGTSPIATVGPCTSGYFIGGAGASADPTCQGFVQSGTGAATRTWQDKARDIVSVKDFGATCDGVTNDTTAINNAIAAASGKALFFPAGTCVVSSLSAIPLGTALIGPSGQNTTLLTNSATADVITVNTGYVTITNLSVASSVTRTAGSYLKIANASGWLRISNFFFSAPFTGITVDSSATIVLIDHGEILNTVASTGNSIIINGGELTKITKVIANNAAGARPFSHLQLNNTGEVTLENVELLSATHNLYIAPGNGQVVTSLKAINSWFDQASTNNVIATPSGTGTFHRSSFIGCWFGSSAAVNVRLTASGSATVDGITFTDNDFLDAGTYGLAADGTGVKNIIVTGGKAAGNVTAAFSFDNISGALVAGVRIGNVAGFGANGVGITLTNAADNVMITANDLRGNTSTVTNTASGTNIIFGSNLGYNPAGIPTGLVQGDIVYGSATGILSRLAKNTSATRYLSNTGSSNNPAWAQIDLTNGVTSTLPAANGGWDPAAWTSYTPSLSCSSGSLTSATATGKYRNVGKTTAVSVTISITTVGTCGTQIIASLPNNSQNVAILAGRETVLTGHSVSGSVAAGASLIGITRYDGAFIGANGQSITVQGIYENQ